MYPRYQLKFSFNQYHNWFTELNQATKQYKNEYNQSAYILLIGIDTINEISRVAEPYGCNLTKDLLGRINFIMDENFVLDVLIDSLPQKTFILINNPTPQTHSNYDRILSNAIENLTKVRNRILNQIVNLSLNGEMSDVQELFQKEQITINYYTLDDFNRVEDHNVKHLREIWHFVDQRITLMEGNA